MRLIAISFVLIMFCCGCVSINYKAPTGEEVKYHRWGDQKVAGFKASKDKEGVFRVEFKSAESDAEALNKAVETLCNLAQAAKSAA